VVIAVFFFGAIMGIVSHMGLDLLDDVIDDKRKLTIWQRRALGFFLAVFFSAVYVWVFHQVLSIPGTWLRSLATGTYFGWQPWSGEFDRSPIWWSVYNFITFFVGYLILYQWISKAVDHFNLSRGVGNPG